MHPRARRNYAHRSCRAADSDEPTQLSAFRDFEDTRPYDALALNSSRPIALREHFRVQSLDGSAARRPARGCRRPAESSTTCATNCGPASPCHFRGDYRPEGFLVLDATTQTHLEIVQARTGGGTSLLAAPGSHGPRRWRTTTSALGCFIHCGDISALQARQP